MGFYVDFVEFSLVVGFEALERIMKTNSMRRKHHLMGLIDEDAVWLFSSHYTEHLFFINSLTLVT